MFVDHVTFGLDRGREACDYLVLHQLVRCLVLDCHLGDVCAVQCSMHTDLCFALRLMGQWGLEALERHGSTKAKAVSQQWIVVHRVNQLLYCMFNSSTLEVLKVMITADGLNQRPYVVQLILRWEAVLGGEG